MKVRLTKDIVEPACGDHPTLVVACKGDVGELVDKAGTWSAYVKIGDREIGLKHDEYEVVD